MVFFTTGMLTAFSANFFFFGGPHSNFGFLNLPSAVKKLRTPVLHCLYSSVGLYSFSVLVGSIVQMCSGDFYCVQCCVLLYVSML